MDNFPLRSLRSLFFINVQNCCLFFIHRKMKRFPKNQTTPAKRPWGGARKNSGRRKLPTPVRKRKYSSKLDSRNISRAYLREKLRKLEERMTNLRQIGSTESDLYKALEIEHAKLVQSLALFESGKRQSECGRPSLQHQDVAGPSSSFQPEHQHSMEVDSSEEVC